MSIRAHLLRLIKRYRPHTAENEPMTTEIIQSKSNGAELSNRYANDLFHIQM